MHKIWQVRLGLHLRSHDHDSASWGCVTDVWTCQSSKHQSTEQLDFAFQFIEDCWTNLFSDATSSWKGLPGALLHWHTCSPNTNQLLQQITKATGTHGTWSQKAVLAAAGFVLIASTLHTCMRIMMSCKQKAESWHSYTAGYALNRISTMYQTMLKKMHMGGQNRQILQLVVTQPVGKIFHHES